MTGSTWLSSCFNSKKIENVWNSILTTGSREEVQSWDPENAACDSR